MVLGTIIMVLIYLCCIALAFYLIEWVLSAIGLQLPGQVITILKVILVLVAIYVLVVNLIPLAGPHSFRLSDWARLTLVG